jgi:hypothetical protein
MLGLVVYKDKFSFLHLLPVICLLYYNNQEDRRIFGNFFHDVQSANNSRKQNDTKNNSSIKDLVKDDRKLTINRAISPRKKHVEIIG